VQTEELVNLTYWKELISQRRWLVVGCTIGVTTLASIFSLIQEPIYQATCTLFLASPKVQLLSFEGVYPDRPGRASEEMTTQIQILRSRPVIERTIQDLEARGTLSFDPASPEREDLLSRMMKHLKVRSKAEPPSADSLRQAFVSKLQRALVVQPVRGDAFLQATVIASNPELAAEIPNAIATAYLEVTRERLQHSGQEAIAWLTSKVREQRDRVAAAEKLLQAAGRPRGVRLADKSAADSTDLGRLQEALMGVRLRLLEAEASASLGSRHGTNEASISRAGDATLQEEFDNTLRTRLRQQLVDNTVTLQELRRRYGEAHPDVIEAAARAERLQKELARLGAETVSAPAQAPQRVERVTQDEIEMLRTQERLLRKNLDEALSTSAAQQQEAVRYEILEREVDLNRRLYNDMLSRLNELTISAGLDSGSAEIFELARLPQVPVSPNHPRSILLGLLAGLLLGVASAAVRDHFDQSVRGPAQVNALLKVPVLGMIPHFGRSQRTGQDAARGILLGSGSESSLIEAYRILRTHIEGALGADESRLLLVTSAVPGEGKSTTAANLAAAFAESGRRVLLIDADLRRPTLSRQFRTSAPGCLTEVLSGEFGPERAVQSTPIANLDVLPCRRPQNLPEDGRITEAYRTLFSWSLERYERVIIDTPVVMALPGVTEMARAGASILLVHRPGWVPSQALEQVRDHLTMSRARLVGVVLNDIRPRWAAGQYPLLAYYASEQPRTANAPANRLPH